jgi:D-sedoheptulose 7-phosphate isomerase
MSLIRQYIAEMQGVLGQMPVEHIDLVVQTLHQARLQGKQVFVMGNGGSASTATHFVCDLGKNTYRTSMPAFRALGLTDNMAIFSAIANDEGYENVFAHQLRNLVQPGDVVIAISGSGNSENVIRAVELANVLGAKTVGFTGMGGGKLAKLVSTEIRVPSDQIQQVEDAHLMLEHMIIKSLNWIDQLEAIGLENEELSIDLFIPSKDTIFDSAAQEKQAELEAQAAEVAPTGVEVPETIDYCALCDLLQNALKMVSASTGSIILLDPNGKVLDGVLIQDFVLKSAWRTHAEDLVKNGLVGWVIRNREPALVNNTRSDPRWFQRPWDTRRNNPRSAISAPLLQYKRVIGAITIVDPNPHRFTLQDMMQLSRMASSTTSTLQVINSATQ